jgi:hypothetical protein
VGQLNLRDKLRLGQRRERKQDRSIRVVIAGHGYVQNLHYELAVEEPVARRLTVAFDVAAATTGLVFCFGEGPAKLIADRRIAPSRCRIA